MLDTDHTGLWATPDGGVRKLLLPNGRFIALVGHGAERHQGDYLIVGARIEYRGDDGRRGTGRFEDGVLYSGTGATLYPEDFAEAASAA
jgi:hypothetical protein